MDRLIDEQWLVDQGLDLADERIQLASPPEGPAGGFDVANPAGLVKVRLERDSTWRVVEGPGGLAGLVFPAAGVAVRAALRGYPWPEGWPADMEREMPTWVPKRPVRVPGLYVLDPEEVTLVPYLRAVDRDPVAEIDINLT